MIRVTKQMSNLGARVEGRVLEEPVMLYDTRLCYSREDWRCILRTYDKFSVRGCSDVDMMLDSRLFIDSVKAGSGGSL